MQFPANYPDSLQAIALACCDSLLKRGFEEADAQTISLEVAHGVSEYLGGRDFYVARGTFLHARQRDENILKAYTTEPLRGNITAVAAMFNVSERAAYKAINRAHAWGRKDRQAELAV